MPPVFLACPLAGVQNTYRSARECALVSTSRSYSESRPGRGLPAAAWERRFKFVFSRVSNSQL